MINVVSKFDLADGWGIFEVAAGVAYLGRCVTPPESPVLSLDPAYGYISEQLKINGQGVQAPMVFVLPLMIRASARTITVRPISIQWLSEWDEDDRKEMAKLIERAEGLREQIRAKRAGIQIVHGAAPLPPISSRG